METHHKPLVPLFNNPHSNPPLRIERWFLYLQQFDFELQYSPRKHNAADYLSWHAVTATVQPLKRKEVRQEVVLYTTFFWIRFQSQSLWRRFRMRQEKIENSQDCHKTDCLHSEWASQRLPEGSTRLCSQNWAAVCRRNCHARKPNCYSTKVQEESPPDLPWRTLRYC